MNPTQTAEQRAALNHIDTLLATMDDLSYVDFEQVKALAQQAQSVTQEWDAREPLARALNYEAWALVNMRQIDAAIDKALRALDYARSRQLLDVEARAINIIASAFIFTRDYVNASQLLEHQCELSARAGDNDLHAMGLHDLGVVYLFTKPYERALKLFQQALTLATPSRYRGAFVGIIHINVGVTYAKLEQPTLALEHGQRGLDIFRSAGSDYYTAAAYNHLGFQYLRCEQADQAEAYLTQARALTEQKGYPEQLATTLALLAQLSRQRGDLPNAIGMYEQATELATQHHVFDNLVEDYAALSEIYQQLGDAQRAKDYHQLHLQTIDAAAFRQVNRRLEILRTIFGAYQSQDQDRLRQLQQLPMVQEPAIRQTHEVQLKQMKQVILQRLAHEFRTPLTLIRTGTDMLDQYYERMTEQQRKAQFEKINDRVAWMTTMLDDILMLLHLNQGKVNLAPQPYDLTETLTHIVNKVETLTDDIARLEMTFDTVPDDFWFDSNLLSIILTQVLSNALKFSKDKVFLKVNYSDGQMLLTIGDRGIGIPPDDVAHVREIFYRGSNLDEHAGYGLGLALVDQAVTAWGGSIEIESQVGIGTTVTIRLPNLSARVTSSSAMMKRTGS